MTYKMIFYEDKFQSELKKYMKNIESKFEFIPFLFSLENIEILSQYKKVFLIIENNIVINVGYINKEKNHIRFLYELPKYKYDFLNEYKSIATAFLNDNFNHDDYTKMNDAIIENETFLKLEGKDYRNIRKKINQFKRLYPNAKTEVFNPKEHKKTDLLNFLKRWSKKYEEKGKFPYLFLDEHLIDYLFLENKIVNGFIIKEKNKIIGFTFYFISPNNLQAIGYSKKNFDDYKGLSEFLVYERSRILLENHNIKYINIGASRDDGILSFKNKLNTMSSPSFTIINKGKELEQESFWNGDHYSD